MMLFTSLFKLPLHNTFASTQYIELIQRMKNKHRQYEKQVIDCSYIYRKCLRRKDWQASCRDDCLCCILFKLCQLKTWNKYKF